MRFGAIILAAGAAARMGGENKLLRVHRGKPLVQHVMEAALAGGLAPRIVVTGRDAAEVSAIAAGVGGFSVHHNPAAALGLSSSLKVGVRALGAGVPGAFVLLGDMPGVTAAVLRSVADAFDDAAYAVLPEHQGKLGNPALLSAAALHDCLALSGDQGARRLLERSTKRVIRAPVNTSAIFEDFDTPDDFKRCD